MHSHLKNSVIAKSTSAPAGTGREVNTSTSSQSRAQRPKSVRLYVFDCGWLKVEDPARFNFKKEELAVIDFSVLAFLVAHPKGILMWDTGVLPDSAFRPGVTEAKKEYATATKPLLPQMAAAGFTPADVDYLAMSHSHWDHIANANRFAHATWLVRKFERDWLLADPPPRRTTCDMFDALRQTKTVIVEDDDYDVFGDGAVVIKFTPGHTAGHQSLFLNLAQTGPVLLTGDLYHYPEDVTMKRVQVGDNLELALKSRAVVEAFVMKTGAQMWIQHDLAGSRKLRKSPAFYE